MVLYVWIFIGVFINLGESTAFITFWVVLELSGYVAIIVIYGDLASAIRKVDLSMMRYLAENQCVDGSLGRAIEVYAGQFKSDNGLIGIAFAFIILSLLCEIMMITCCNTWFYGKICCKEKKEEA